MSKDTISRISHDLDVRRIYEDKRSEIVKERDNELYWGNTQKAAELTKQLATLPQGTRRTRRAAARQLRRFDVWARKVLGPAGKVEAINPDGTVLVRMAS